MDAELKVVCRVCGEKFELYVDLKDHVKSEHPGYWKQVREFVSKTSKETDYND